MGLGLASTMVLLIRHSAVRLRTISVTVARLSTIGVLRLCKEQWVSALVCQFIIVVRLKRRE